MSNIFFHLFLQIADCLTHLDLYTQNVSAAVLSDLLQLLSVVAYNFPEIPNLTLNLKKTGEYSSRNTATIGTKMSIVVRILKRIKTIPYLIMQTDIYQSVCQSINISKLLRHYLC